MTSKLRQPIFSFDMDMDVDETPKKMKPGKFLLIDRPIGSSCGKYCVLDYDDMLLRLAREMRHCGQFQVRFRKCASFSPNHIHNIIQRYKNSIQLFFLEPYLFAHQFIHYYCYLDRIKVIGNISSVLPAMTSSHINKQ